MKNLVTVALGATLALTVVGGLMVFNQKQGADHGTEHSAAQQPTVSEAIAWQSYDEGLTIAASQNKLVMVEFFATWCGYCKKMDNTVFPDANVRRELEKYFVPVRVTESSLNEVQFKGKAITEQALTQEFGVTGFPTLVFLDQSGEPITKIPGFVPADTLEGALQFIGTGSYETMDYETFKKKNQS